MRTLDPAFQNHLQSGATTLATCWRIERRDGVVLGFTDHDRALNFDGVTFAPETGASGSAIVSTADLAIDNADIEGILNDDALSADDLSAGRYDGAQVEVFRVNWADPSQRVQMKAAVIGEVLRQGDEFRAELRGLSHHLDQAVGRVYQRLCDINVGSARCGVDLDDPAYRTSGNVTALRGEQGFSADGFDLFEDGWFALGTIEWTSGDNVGDKIHIQSQSRAGDIGLWLPAGNPIQIGDGFVARAGCDKRFETCREKFSNAVNFRGFHLMPGNDFAVSYPLRGENNDGGQR